MVDFLLSFAEWGWAWFVIGVVVAFAMSTIVCIAIMPGAPEDDGAEPVPVPRDIEWRTSHRADQRPRPRPYPVDGWTTHDRLMRDAHETQPIMPMRKPPGETQPIWLGEYGVGR